MLANTLETVITLTGVPRARLPRIIVRLRAWRKRNGLSQRAAAEVMTREGYRVGVGSIRAWEIGRSAPGELATRALEAFLDAHPVITDPPKYGRWVHRRREDER